MAQINSLTSRNWILISYPALLKAGIPGSRARLSGVCGLGRGHDLRVVGRILQACAACRQDHRSRIVLC